MASRRRCRSALLTFAYAFFLRTLFCPSARYIQADSADFSCMQASLQAKALLQHQPHQGTSTRSDRLRNSLSRLRSSAQRQRRRSQRQGAPYFRVKMILKAVQLLAGLPAGLCADLRRCSRIPQRCLAVAKVPHPAPALLRCSISGIHLNRACGP
jgi:hypothetical protein